MQESSRLRQPSGHLTTAQEVVGCTKAARHRTARTSVLRGAQRSRYNGGVGFTVRDFQPEDFDVLWHIDQDCFPPGISYSRQELKLYLRRPRSFALVALRSARADAPTPNNASKLSKPTLSGNPIAGFVVAEAGRLGSGHIITIDVVAAARRAGVGSLLLRAAEARLRAAGCGSVVLETAVDNSAALSFYKRHGYTVIRTFPRYYSNGVDALVLGKSLRDNVTKSTQEAEA